MRRTKIVCTMGPNTNSRDLMKKLIETGMDVARFNFSHGDHDEQKMRMDMLKELRKELKTPVAILLDTKGPEIRLTNGADCSGFIMSVYAHHRRFHHIFEPAPTMFHIMANHQSYNHI